MHLWGKIIEWVCVYSLVTLYFLSDIMVAFQIFWFSIYWYGLFYALAFVLWYLGLWWIWKQGFFAKFPKVQWFLTEGLEDLILAIAVGVLVWGRLGHVLIYGEGYYLHHFSAIFRVWEGWMSFIWGIIGVVSSVGLLLYVKKMTWRDFLLLFDLILIFVPLGIFFGRFGNFLNQELYGIPLDSLPVWFATILSNLHLTHVYPHVDRVLRVNTNFLSMILEGMLIFGVQLFIFFSQIKKKKWKIWLLSVNFLLLYSVIRFWLEYLRADSQMEIVGVFSKSQRFFLVFVMIACFVRWKYVEEEGL